MLPEFPRSHVQFANAPGCFKAAAFNAAKTEAEAADVPIGPVFLLLVFFSIVQSPTK